MITRARKILAEKFINASLPAVHIFVVYGKFCDLTVNRLNKMTNDKLANKLRLAILVLARIKLHCAAFPLAVRFSAKERRPTFRERRFFFPSLRNRRSFLISSFDRGVQ